MPGINSLVKNCCFVCDPFEIQNDFFSWYEKRAAPAYIDDFSRHSSNCWQNGREILLLFDSIFALLLKLEQDKTATIHWIRNDMSFHNRPTPPKQWPSKRSVGAQFFSSRIEKKPLVVQNPFPRRSVKKTYCSREVQTDFVMFELSTAALYHNHNVSCNNFMPIASTIAFCVFGEREKTGKGGWHYVYSCGG